MPVIETPPEDTSTDRVPLTVVIALASLLLLLLLLLLFLAMTPPAGSGGGRGAADGTGAGSQAGVGSGASEHGTKDGGAVAGAGRDDSLGELDDKNQTGDERRGGGNQGQKPDKEEPGVLTEGESEKPQSVPQNDERPESEPVSEERSLGERIAENLSNAPPKPDEQRDSGGSGFGAVTVRVFGVGGHGKKFVFVFDRSESMTGQKLLDAKKELLESLSVLNGKHHFNIIFYDDTFVVWKPGEKLVPASVSEKKDAEEFVRKIKTQGGTSHLPPLLEAIKFKPEVIFFLTDGQSLAESELKEIVQKNDKISINVIQFAESGESKSEILRQLAAQNRGRYKYVNASNSDAL